MTIAIPIVRHQRPAAGYSARHRLDQMAENRGWCCAPGELVDPHGWTHVVSNYSSPDYELVVVWTQCDHVSRATLRRTGTGLVDAAPSEWERLPMFPRWNKRFTWAASRLFDLAPAHLQVLPHARLRSM